MCSSDLNAATAALPTVAAEPELATAIMSVVREVLLTVVAAVVGYLLGTIPSAGVVAWLATRGKINLREAGSGNPGAINAIKMLGTRWGVVVLVADIAKGAAAGLLGLLIAGDPGAYAAATAAIAGHIFPVWSGFRGGKGVAAGVGSSSDQNSAIRKKSRRVIPAFRGHAPCAAESPRGGII